MRTRVHSELSYILRAFKYNIDSLLSIPDLSFKMLCRVSRQKNHSSLEGIARRQTFITFLDLIYKSQSVFMTSRWHATRRGVARLCIASKIWYGIRIESKCIQYFISNLVLRLYLASSQAAEHFHSCGSDWSNTSWCRIFWRRGAPFDIPFG